MRQKSMGTKFFAGSQYRRQKNGWFGELSTDEIQEIMDKAVLETAKKSYKVRDDVI